MQFGILRVYTGTAWVNVDPLPVAQGFNNNVAIGYRAEEVPVPVALPEPAKVPNPTERRRRIDLDA